MELYNPAHVDLPALKIKKTSDRQKMENDITVNNLVRSNILLDKKFNTLYLDILGKSKELLKVIKTTDEKCINEVQFLSMVIKSPKRSEYSGLLGYMARLERGKNIPKCVKREYAETEYAETIYKLKKVMYTDFQKNVIMLSNQIQNSISVFEEEKNIELLILSSTNIHFCKKCARIISIDKFNRRTCFCGEKITKISQVKQIPIHHFNPKLINFLDRNYWLEYGVDYLLRRNNLQTLVGYHVLGHSGVWHEIDNIADSKLENHRFFCECKNAEVTVNDIFVFSGKMIDVGCTRGYIFTTSDKGSNEIVRLARSKNMVLQ